MTPHSATLRITIVATLLIAAALALASTMQSYRRLASDNTDFATLAKATAAALAPHQARHRSGIVVIAALSDRPLAPAPLVGAGLDAALTGDDARARALIVEGLRRDPRSRPARIWLAATALRAGDLSAASRQIDRLMTLDHATLEAYYPLLAELVRQPGGERAVAAILRRAPDWRDAFLGYLNSRGVSPDVVFRLDAPSAAAAKGESSAEVSLIESLVAQGNFDRAYLAWLNFLPRTALDAVGLVYDGDFVGLAGPRPFNWRFADSALATVGLERGEGLQIDYPGAASVTLASEVVMLTPGHYRLDYVARGSPASADAGEIDWRIACLPNGPVALSLPVTDLTDSPSRRSAAFEIAAGCKAQLLTLEGIAGAFATARSVTLRHVGIGVMR